MDPVTHAVAGLAIAWTTPALLNIPPESVEAKTIFWACLLGSQAPDADFILRLTGSVNYLKFHRVITHGFLSLPILALIIALFLAAFFSIKIFWLAFFSAILALLSHIFLDLLTPYGTLVYWPFKHRAYAWDLLMIIDPVLIGIPLLAKTLALLGIVTGKLAASVALGIVVGYLLIRFIIHTKIVSCLARLYYPSEKIAVLPNYLGMLKWKFVIKKENSYLLGNIIYPTCKIAEINHERSTMGVPENLLVKAASSTTAKVFLQFAKFPLLRYRHLDGGHLFQWTDLRYRFKGYEFFRANVFILNSGEIIHENLGDIGGGSKKANSKQL